MNDRSPTLGHIDIKALLGEEEGVIRNAHFAGASGSEIVQRRTALIDRTLKSLYAPCAGAECFPTLIAIGGYGRGELNPFSDIDLLFLCRDDREREQAPRMLYALWDAGLDIGYSVRTISECVVLSRGDARIRTALLESRVIAGDDALYRSFRQRMQEDVFYRQASAYVSDKIADRIAARQKYGGSLYLREPNIKESSGGLRDFHNARWLAMTHFRVSSFDELVPLGVITRRQLTGFLRSRDFLWRIRNELHYLAGRKNDHLTFDLQEAAAKDFHFRDSTHLHAVERFMKAYFLRAREVQEFSRIVTESVLPPPKRSWTDRVRSLGPFNLLGGILAPVSEEALGADPALIMEAFEAYQKRHTSFSRRLREIIEKTRFGDEARTSPGAAKTFLDILNDPVRLSDTLWLMKDLKFLGRYVPEFRAVQALARRDYYHTYTVDEHTLTAVRALEELWAGRYPGLSVLMDAFRSLKQRWVLTLALLLHDLGKSCRGSHERRGRELAAGVLDRLGISGREHAQVLQLIEHHQVMSTLSQRRELTDRKVIADFARTVGDAETLSMLYLLTYADISAVSPGAWTQWKAALLQELYTKTMLYFEQAGKAGEEERLQVATARDRLAAVAAGAFPDEDISGFVSAMPVHYLAATSAEKQLRHFKMVRRLMDEQLVIEHRHRPELGYTELTVCAYDAYGMFYRTAGTIASQNLSILRAMVFTAKNGIMIDTFHVTDADGAITQYDDVWRSVIGELREVLAGIRRPPVPAPSKYARSASFDVQATVTFDNESSDALTIIDITARDRIGLLYRIAKALYDMNLDIASAKIVTEGARVADAFYVSDLFRAKIVDPDRLAKISETLLAVLQSTEH